jgi:hypothetical protein
MVNLNDMGRYRAVVTGPWRGMLNARARSQVETL